MENSTNINTTTIQNKSKALHLSLWVAQGLLAAAFGMAGVLKLSKSINELASMGMGFVLHFSEGMVRFIGLTEVLAALGLILPSALRIKPILTPIAASGVAIIMILASKEHLSQNEPVVANLVLFSLAVFVAWGRFKKSPIQSK